VLVGGAHCDPAAEVPTWIVEVWGDDPQGFFTLDRQFGSAKWVNSSAATIDDIPLVCTSDDWAHCVGSAIVGSAGFGIQCKTYTEGGFSVEVQIKDKDGNLSLWTAVPNELPEKPPK
jgi:hypothetical protein